MGSLSDYGKSLLHAEAEALLGLGNSLGESFESAVKVLLDMPVEARVAVLGMGKAGLIGNKISSTLSSIGVSSFFLHPAEAVHGDLGRLRRGDIALFLSKSGETREILETLPYLKEMRIPIISITQSDSSSLGKASDICLEIGEIQEAGPHSLAPTTSTVAMLGIGDALAMTVAHERGLSPDEFAGFHPAGALGRSLMQCSQVMRSGSRHCIVKESDTGMDVIKEINSTDGRPGAASVVNDNGVLVGIFTDGDIRRCLETDTSFLNEPVAKVMGRNPKTISPTKLVQEALSLMTSKEIDQLIVTDSEGCPVGMVDIQDLFE